MLNISEPQLPLNRRSASVPIQLLASGTLCRSPTHPSKLPEEADCPPTDNHSALHQCTGREPRQKLQRQSTAVSYSLCRCLPAGGPADTHHPTWHPDTHPSTSAVQFSGWVGVTDSGCPSLIGTLTLSIGISSNCAYLCRQAGGGRCTSISHSAFSCELGVNGKGADGNSPPPSSSSNYNALWFSHRFFAILQNILKVLL